MSDKNFFFISLYFRTRFSLPWRLKTYFSVRPVVHVRKEPSKVPRAVVSSAVSFRVRRNFLEKFASQKHKENTKHVWYFPNIMASQGEFLTKIFCRTRKETAMQLSREGFCSALPRVCGGLQISSSFLKTNARTVTKLASTSREADDIKFNYSLRIPRWTKW